MNTRDKEFLVHMLKMEARCIEMAVDILEHPDYAKEQKVKAFEALRNCVNDLRKLSEQKPLAGVEDVAQHV